VKAIILAGGRGIRGRPYTDYFPKAMIPIDGVPLIQYVAEYLDSFSIVRGIIIVADFEGLGAQIRNHFEGQKIARRMRFVQDSQSGTGGDLVHAEKALGDAREFILWFVDNFCALDVRAMKKQFDMQKSTACVAIRTKRKEETGFARVVGGKIVEFREKPVMSLPLSECLGVYMLDAKILDLIKKVRKRNVNLSFDVLEGLAKKSQISAYDIGDAEWLDVESPVIVDRNQKLVKRIKGQMGF